MSERLLRLRQVMNQKRPKFLHQEHWKLKRFRKAPWRKPRGKRSKMRTKERAKPFLVSIGYRGPREVRGWHPKGVPEITVYNVQDVERLEAEKEKESRTETKRRKTKKKTKKGKGKGKGNYVVRIASSVGTRKKIQIVKAAVEKNLYVANPAIKAAKISSMEELESLTTIREYIKTWHVSDKAPEEEREDIMDRAEELGIEVVV